MSRFIKIPSYQNPYEVIINGVKYQYPAGKTCLVPDDVAMVIENAESNAPKYVKESGRMSGIVEGASGKVIVVSDSEEAPLQGLKVFGKTVQNGTPTPDAPVALESVGAGGCIAVNVGVSQDDPNAQTIPIFTRNGLLGIPTTSGGNYTDENGQQWICDEVDFEKGVYVQRVRNMTPEDIINSGLILYGTNDAGIANFQIPLKGTLYEGVSLNLGLCSHMSKQSSMYADTTEEGVYFVGGGNVFVRLNSSRASTVKDFKAWVANSNLNIQYILANHIEHSLTSEELATYSAMHTNSPNTAVYNDAGAEMEVKYVADTKMYVDNKFNVLAAMVNNV